MTHALFDSLVQALGGFPPRQPYESRLMEVVECPSYRREKHVLLCENRIIPLYLLLPQADGPRPGILAHHQHAGEYHLGKSEPAGITGNPEMFYAHRLAECGYVAVTWDCIGFEERYNAIFGRNHEHYLAMKAIAQGGCLQREYLMDTLYVTDFLVSRPEVQPEQIGCIGHSLGGQNVLFNLLMDARVKSGVASCGIATLSSFLEENITHNFAWYVPGLLQMGDTPALAPLLSGKNLFISQGSHDPIFPLRGVHNFATAAAEVANVQTFLFEGGHSFPIEAMNHAIEFLNKTLRG